MFPKKIKAICDVWGNIFTITKGMVYTATSENDGYYLVTKDLDYPDNYGRIVTHTMTQYVPCHHFVIENTSVCICGAAKLGYTKPSKHHSHGMKCPLYKEN